MDTERLRRLREHWKLPPELEELPVLLQLLGGQDAGKLAKIYAEQIEREKKEHKKPSHLPRAPDWNDVAPGL